MEEYSTDVDFLGTQRNQASFGTPPQAVVILPLSRSYDQFLHPGELEPPSRVLSSIPEDRQVPGQGECHSGNPSVSHPGEPPAKKQHIECENCHERFGATKSLTRHEETCEKRLAKLGISPKSHRCDACPKSFRRKDILFRHVQTIHLGQSRKRQQGSGVTAQQSSSNTAQESQGSVPQPQTMHFMTTRPSTVASNAFTGSSSTHYYGYSFQYSGTNDIIASELAAGEHQTETYPIAPAAEPDLQSCEYGAGSWVVDWTPDQSSIGYQGTSISAPSNELTPATSNPSLASFVHEVDTTTSREIDDDAEFATLSADAALAAAVEQQLSLHDVPYRSANPVSQGRNLRPRRIENPTPCPLCGYEFGQGPNDDGQVKTHLERHKKRMEAVKTDTVSDSEATCTHCQLHFLLVRDLERHQRSVQRGEGCGFNFHHHGILCTGHHPRTIGGQVNLDHRGFENCVREWEDLQRDAYAEYFDDYTQGTATTNAPSYGEVPRRRTFEENLEAYSKGLTPTMPKPTCRRSTGSMYSEMSLKSIMSTLTTPVRFRYGGEVKHNIRGVTRKRVALLIRDLAEACEHEKFNFVTRLFFNSPLSTLQNISEDDLRIKVDSSWYSPVLRIERIRCLAFLVEQGLNLSESSAMQFVTIFQGTFAEDLLVAKKSPIKAQSRLTQYAFLMAIVRGLNEVVWKLLKHGTLDTHAGMPDAEFIRELHGSRSWSGDRTALSFDFLMLITNLDIGPYALVLALNARQYHAASLLITYGVEPFWGIHYLTTSKSAMQHLEDELRRCRNGTESTILPDDLDLLERRLMDFTSTPLASPPDLVNE